MKSYNVKEVAATLNISEETVRRWIRNKKLHAKKESRKSGNVITESELRRFIKAFPRYMPRFYSGVGSLTTHAAELALGGLIGVIFCDYLSRLKDKDRITRNEFKAYLDKEIKQQSIILEKKKELLNKTQTEIDEIEIKIKQYEYVLDNEELLNSMFTNDKVKG